ncbi:AMP-binding protein, partial [Rubrivirga sp.]|uniref:AMP-binding protein n=1 Tax=Rubrivirga sp. TaxID=1885344 RepID=UPI003C78292D
LYHVGGLGIVMRCVLAGATMAVPSRSAPAAERVERFRPTHASFVSTQLQRLLDADADLSSLHAVLLGGSAMPAALIDRALEAGVPAVVSYGLTEMTSTVTATRLPPSRSDLATSGAPLPHRDVRISDDGEIEVGGPTRYVGRVFEGEILPAPEWHPTGDIGRFDAEGRLIVTGRRDLQFVSGGENVHPEPIEAALSALDGVLEAVVVPVPDLEFGHRPAAFVRLEDVDPTRDASTFLRTCLEDVRATLPSFMVPIVAYEWGGAEGLKPDRPALTREAERRTGERSE